MGCAVIVAGSDSDKSHIEKLAAALKTYEIPYDVRICSAHKSPGRLLEILAEYRGLPLVWVAVAGGTDALSGTLAFHADQPVVSCPPDGPNTSCLTNPPGSSNATILKPQNVARFEQAVREELDRMLKDGLTEKEIADAKNGLLQERVVNRSNDGIVASTWTAYLDLGRTFTSYSLAFDERIRSLTAAEVNAALRRHLDPARMTVVIAGDAATGAK